MGEPIDNERNQRTPFDPLDMPMDTVGFEILKQGTRGNCWDLEAVSVEAKSLGVVYGISSPESWLQHFCVICLVCLWGALFKRHFLHLR